MTVGELIAKLKEYPADSQVVTSGETGYACKVVLVDETEYPYKFISTNATVDESTIVVELYFDEDCTYSHYPCL
jgi:hypothetical protein